MIKIDQAVSYLIDVAMTWLADAMAVATFIMAAISAWNVREMRVARHNATRPVIALTVEVRRNGLICLVVKNIGGGTASKVRIEVPQVLRDALEGNEHAAIARMDTVSLTLAPGQEMLYVIGTSVTLRVLELPAATFEVSYVSLSGKKYRDSIEIDFPGLGPGLLYSTEMFEALKPLTKEVQILRTDLGRIEHTLRDIREGIEALKHDAQDDLEMPSAQ